MIEARISGIPCLIDVINTGWSTPAITHLLPEDCHPADGECADYVVCDRRGRPAPWLQRKMTDKDIDRIEQLIQEEYA